MFWVRIRLGRRKYLAVLDTRATISIVAKNILPAGDLQNITPAAAICMGDGHLVHSSGDCEVDVPMASRSIAHHCTQTSGICLPWSVAATVVTVISDMYIQINMICRVAFVALLL